MVDGIYTVIMYFFLCLLDVGRILLLIIVFFIIITYDLVDGFEIDFVGWLASTLQQREIATGFSRPRSTSCPEADRKEHYEWVRCVFSTKELVERYDRLWKKYYKYVCYENSDGNFCGVPYNLLPLVWNTAFIICAIVVYFCTIIVEAVLVGYVALHPQTTDEQERKNNILMRCNDTLIKEYREHTVENGKSHQQRRVDEHLVHQETTATLQVGWFEHHDWCDYEVNDDGNRQHGGHLLHHQDHRYFWQISSRPSRCFCSLISIAIIH